VPLKDFRFFSCGHRWCSSCLKKHKADPLCGECRQPKGKPHRIYLDLEDLVDDQVALVADGLNSLNMDSSPSDIEKFNRTVRKLRQRHSTDPAVSRALLEAVEDLKKRVTPSVERCSEFKNLNEALNRQLEELRSHATIFKEKLKRAKLSVQAEKDETKRLRLSVDRQRIAKEAVMTEKKELQAKLESRDKEIKLLNTKLKVLSKKQKVKSTRNVEDTDSSFQVEPKTELNAKRRRIKRLPVWVSNSSDIDSPRPFKKLRS